MGDPVVHALLPAAGRGRRFGDALLKQYAPVAGRPVLAHAIEAVLACPEVRNVTVLLAAGDDQFERLIAPMFPQVHTAIGGASRADSVLAGLHSIRATDPAADWVMVHDAARPLLPLRCIRRLLRQGLSHPDGAILAVPMRDTLKRDNGSGEVGETVSREGLWAAQTPQLFPLLPLLKALEHCMAAGIAPTDEAAAMEHSGARPLLVMGSPANIKITYPDDLMLVESCLASGNKEVDQ